MRIPATLGFPRINKEQLLSHGLMRCHICCVVGKNYVGNSGGGGEGGRVLNITRANKNCWSQMKDDLACEVVSIHQAVRARAIKIVQILSVNRDQNF